MEVLGAANLGGTAITTATPLSRREAELRELAIRFEASFLSEMLKAAGLGETTGAFGGGVGETQFASFLRDAQAEEMARAGGLGLAEVVFQAMKDMQNDE